MILGCSHDSGYAPFLEKYAADDSIRERVTLLKGQRIDSRIAALGFKNVLKLDSVFASQKVKQVPWYLLQPHQLYHSQQNARILLLTRVDLDQSYVMVMANA